MYVFPILLLSALSVGAALILWEQRQIRGKARHHEVDAQGIHAITTAMAREYALNANNARVLSLPSDAVVESCAWDTLSKIALLTTDDGPWGEDVFWLFMDSAGGGCAVPNGVIRSLLPHLQELADFNNEALLMAMCQTDNHGFEVWSGEPGQAAHLGARYLEPEVLA